MNKLIVILVLSILSLSFVSSPVMAQEVQTCVQVTQYGGGVGIVCGAHTPVETGLADINPIVLASIFFASAGMGLKIYKKTLKAEVAL